MSAGHCGPTCSSSSAPTRKTGTLMCVAHAVGERWLNSAGVRPRFGLTSDSRLCACRWRRWLARQVLSPVAISAVAQGWPPPGAGRASETRSRHPAGGEAVVVDPARVAGRVEVVGRAERRDGRQVRRVGAGHDQLGEARVGDPHHPDLVVEDPGLGADGLDDVVAVVVGGQAEQVEGAAGAAGAAHLDADGGEAEQRRDDRADDGRGVGQQGIVRRGADPPARQ